ncbi:MAG: hypothetical protein JWR37_4471 [Mycobacterium sp.]|nr:hypothetical protein [Mycobacterium sp.]
MSDATNLRKEFLANVRGPEKASALFAENGAFEMPFFVSLGLATRFEGPEGVKACSRRFSSATPTSSSRRRTSPYSSTPATRCSPNTSGTPRPRRPGGARTTCSWGASSPATAKSRCCARA